MQASTSHIDARPCLALLLAGTALTLAPAGTTQSAFVNFETPQIQPITVFRAGGLDYVAVCNTPDNSVEIYRAAGLAFVASFKTGLEPVTVRWHAPTGRLYTTNFLGDSVSMARVAAVPGQPLHVVLERTSWVGDEPTDIEFVESGGQSTAFVSLHSRSALVTVDANTLAVQGPPGRQEIPLVFPFGSSRPTKAMKEPRQVRSFDGKLFVLAGKGGNDAGTFDYDLFSLDLISGLQSDLGGLGSTNHAMAMTVDDRLLVVGTLARNELRGHARVAAAPTGFVESRLWVVRNAGTKNATVDTRDLNRDVTGQIATRDKALSQPTGVAVYTSPEAPLKVFVAAFHSDRLGVLHPSERPAARWPITHIDLPVQRATYKRTGPRGLAFKPANPHDPKDPGPRIYVANFLSQSISEIDPVNEVEVRRVGLQNDPTPSHIRVGRASLFSAELSGNGFVSCASCHVDARTDSLAWDLGKTGLVDGDPIAPTMLDGVTGPPLGPTFPADKGPMVTQSLQGLLNYPINPAAQYLFSNAPYHWRGDRSVIESFNIAFVELQGMQNLAAAGEAPRGIPLTQMHGLGVYLNTIMYPPNPEQSWSRTYSGEFGTPDAEDGWGAQRGLKLFHTRPLRGNPMGGRSCVHCHALPEGSNNRITIANRAGGSSRQPIETPALRKLFQREARLEAKATGTVDVPTGAFGLGHTGSGPGSIDSFILDHVGDSFAGEPRKLADLISFVREMDSGVAPSIGSAITVHVDNKNSAAVIGFLVASEQQAAQANTGLTVFVRANEIAKGYWFDLTANPPGYREEGTSTVLSRSALLQQLTTRDDVFIAQNVPVGSEQRVAALNGRPRVLRGPPPRNVKLQPMRASTPWRDVSRLTKNWSKGPGPLSFEWSGTTAPGVLAPEPLTLKVRRIYQHALIHKAPQFGVTAAHHDPSRRFRVSGDDIRPGALMVLGLPLSQPPYSPTLSMVMPIFPSGEVTPDGQRIWETVIEAEAFIAHELMIGGPLAPGVSPSIEGLVKEPPPPSAFNPAAWNLYSVSVFNSDGTGAFGIPGHQPITVQ